MKAATLLALALCLTGCVSMGAPEAIVPETVTLEAGTSVRHEVGETPARVNTVLGRVQWRLRR